ncbi:MAG TPA: polysaccharide biosynthesis/export family protein [Nitrospiraceae bacterium]|nr:polysaccharide biosynthesis/export family protein [Nitrospiraceae bacterium]
MIHVRTLLIVGALLGMSVSCAPVSKEALEEASKPVPKEFLLGPEDVLEVSVWRNQDLSRTVVVRPDGKISLPLVGDVQASGLNASQVAAKIAAKLTEFKENPNVSVSLKEVNSYFIFVLGEVLKPGKYPLKSYVTVLQGVSMAGGFTPYASKNRMQVIRTRTNEDGKESQIRIPVPYNELVSGKGEIDNFILKSGDTIVVQ